MKHFDFNRWIRFARDIQAQLSVWHAIAIAVISLASYLELKFVVPHPTLATVVSAVIISAVVCFIVIFTTVDNSALAESYWSLTNCNTNEQKVITKERMIKSLKSSPPTLEWLLWMFATRDERDELETWLPKEYQRAVAKFGVPRAKLYYAKQIFIIVQPMIRKWLKPAIIVPVLGSVGHWIERHWPRIQ